MVLHLGYCHTVVRVFLKLVLLSHYVWGISTVQPMLRVSSFTLKPVACKPVILVCMTPWMRNWSLASGSGSVLLYDTWPQGYWATGFVFPLLSFPLCFPRSMLHSLSVWCVLILFQKACCQQARLSKVGLRFYAIHLFCCKVKDNVSLSL